MRLCHDGIFKGSDGSDLSAFQVVLTRYNMEFGPRKTAKRWASPKRQRWLENRLDHFTTFCLPSLVNQTKHPDLWLLGFDGESPEAVQPVLDAVKDYPWIVPVWQQGVAGVYEDKVLAFTREILARLPLDRTHLITSRVDNDDAINRHFLEFIRAYSSAVVANKCLEDFWLAFPFGAFYSGTRCISYVYPNNPFCSRVQAVSILADDSRTVFEFQHARLFLNGCKVFLPLTEDPMWIRNYHGENLAVARIATRRRFSPTSSRAVLRECGVELARERKPADHWARSWESSADGRRSRRHWAKRLLYSTGLMKPKLGTET